MFLFENQMTPLWLIRKLRPRLHVIDMIVQVYAIFSFSAVYGMESTQQQIYVDCVQPLLSKTLSGQNVSIFAYGPTGAGNTIVSELYYYSK